MPPSPPDSESPLPLSAVDAADAEAVDDLVQINTLTADTAIHAIRHRYQRGQIYTNVHSILIAVNPYRTLPNMYGPHELSLYSTRVPVESRLSLPPHVFAIARDAYERATEGVNGAQPQSQAILIAGESGAGKTETTRYLLSYIAAMSSSHHPSSSDSSSSSTSAIESQLLLANPILESLGNAKTSRNDNSSRFGKWVSILMKSDGSGISGARLQHYLLEESRIITRGPEERSFNVFYGLLAHDRVSDPNGPTPMSFNYLHAHSPDSALIAGVDDAKRFDEVLTCLRQMSMPEETQTQLFNILRGILWLGEIRFIEDGEKDGSKICSTCDVALEHASHFFGLPSATLRTSLCVKIVVSGRQQSMMRMVRNVIQACEIRDSISKHLYGKVFTFVMEFLNRCLKGETHQTTKGSKKIEPITLGILDIFGFEQFFLNSFEQLCINFANEKLHQHFLQQVFRFEQEELQMEGIQLPEGYSSNPITFEDNLTCLELFERRSNGLFALLNDELAIPKGSDRNFVQKCHDIHGGEGSKGHKNYSKPSRSSASAASASSSSSKVSNHDFSFVIHHYADSVTYDATNFLDKNRSKVNDNVWEMFQQHTSNQVLLKLFQQDIVEKDGEDENNNNDQNDQNGTSAKASNSNSIFRRSSVFAASNHPPQSTQPIRRSSMVTSSSSSSSSSSSKKPTSLASQFSQSLNSLFTSITDSHPHFIRCIKPNLLKTSQHFDDTMVLKQLSNHGLINLIKQRQQQLQQQRKFGWEGGYIQRQRFQEFIRRYRCIEVYENIVKRKKTTASAAASSSSSSSTNIVALPPSSTIDSLPPSSLIPYVTQLLAQLSALTNPSSTTPTIDTPLSPFQIGRTRIFFTGPCYEQFERVRMTLLTTVTIRLQSSRRGLLTRRTWSEHLMVYHRLVRASKLGHLQDLEDGLIIGRRVNLPPKQLQPFEKFYNMLCEMNELQHECQTFFQQNLESLNGKRIHGDHILQQGLCIGLIDLNHQPLPIDKKNHPLPMLMTMTPPTTPPSVLLKTRLQQSLRFISEYVRILDTIDQELKQLLDDIKQQSSSLENLSSFLATIDDRCDSIFQTISFEDLLPSNSSIILRSLSTSIEVEDAKKRLTTLKTFLQDFQHTSSDRQSYEDTLRFVKFGLEEYDLNWKELKEFQRCSKLARKLEEDVNDVIQQGHLNRLQDLSNELKDLQVQHELCHSLTFHFSTKDTTVSNLLKILETYQQQSKLETSCEESLKHAMSKGDVEEIQKAVQQAEQAIQQRQKRASVTTITTSPPPSASSSDPTNVSRPLPIKRAPHHLDDLVTLASLDLKRLTRLRDCRLALKSLNGEYDDIERMRHVLNDCIEVGISKDEIESLQRRLCEVETRLKLQDAIDRREKVQLETCIRIAEERLSKNEMEIRSNRFQDILHLARHTLQVLKLVEALDVAGEELIQLRQSNRDDEDAIRMATSSFKSSYTHAVLGGVREDELERFHILIESIRRSEGPTRPVMSKEELMTQGDFEAIETKKHYEDIRKKMKIEDEEKMRRRQQQQQERVNLNEKATVTGSQRRPSNESTPVATTVTVTMVPESSSTLLTPPKSRSVSHSSGRPPTHRTSDSSFDCDQPGLKGPHQHHHRRQSSQQQQQQDNRQHRQQCSEGVIHPIGEPSPNATATNATIAAAPSAATPAGPPNVESKSRPAAVPFHPRRSSGVGSNLDLHSCKPLGTRPVVRYPTLDDPIAEEAQREHQRRASILQRQEVQMRLERERREQEEFDQRLEGHSKTMMRRIVEKKTKKTSCTPTPPAQARKGANDENMTESHIDTSHDDDHRRRSRSNRHTSGIVFECDSSDRRRSVSSVSTVDSPHSGLPPHVCDDSNAPNRIAIVLLEPSVGVVPLPASLPVERRPSISELNRHDASVIGIDGVGDSHRWSVDLADMESTIPINQTEHNHHPHTQQQQQQQQQEAHHRQQEYEKRNSVTTSNNFKEIKEYHKKNTPKRNHHQRNEYASNTPPEQTPQACCEIM